MKYRHSTNGSLGFRENSTLIEFFLHKKVTDFDIYAEGIEQLVYLSSLKLIDININE